MPARRWTPEQRKKQAEAIKLWKPWEQSTGPRSAEGKARVGKNRWRGGTREQLRALARALTEQRKLLVQIAGLEV